MNDHIDEMIAEHIILMNVVVQGECIESHETFQFPCIPDGVNITDIANVLIRDNVSETVGIDDSPHDTDENQGEKSGNGGRERTF